MARLELTVVLWISMLSHGLAQTDLFSFNVKDHSGKIVPLSKYRGQVLLIVNVASECGFTDGHYRGLVKLQNIYSHSKRLQVLAFPCNQFGAQEPKTASEILRWAEATYNVNFPIFDKINVIHHDVSPVFKYLIDATGNEPTWNFFKYLVSHEGKVIKSWGPWSDIEEIYPDVKAAVEAQSHSRLSEGSRGPEPPAPSAARSPAHPDGDAKQPEPARRAGPPKAAGQKGALGPQAPVSHGQTRAPAQRPPTSRKHDDL